jgi:hypothetical protein
VVAQVVTDSVVAAVEREVDGWDVGGSALAATALALARELDATGNSATAKSNCARVLVETLDRLRQLAPAAEASDRLDDLATRRVTRRAG